MASYGGVVLSNAAAALSCNSSSVILQDIAQICSTYITSLQACSVDTVNQQDRFQIVNQTALCFSYLWYSDGNPSLYSNYTQAIGPPPEIPNSGSCHYPDFMPILENSCTFDYNRVNYTCTSDGYTYAYGLTPWIYCSTEAMLQYWRCTKQVSYDNVAACVEENAVKSDWIPQFQPYNGANSCPDTTSYLLKQGFTMLSGMFTTALSTMFGSILSDKLKQLLKRKKGKTVAANIHNIEMNLWSSRDLSGTEENSASGHGEFETQNVVPSWRKPWEYETGWVLDPSSLLRSIGKEVLTAYLTVLVLQRNGMAGVYSVDDAFRSSLLVYVIRPRVAPLTGLLGFFKGFSETGFADVFTDGMLSWVAGTWVLVRFWPLTFLPPANPAAPVAALKILGIGAALSSAPSFFFFCIIVLVSFYGAEGIWEGLIVFGFILALIAAFLCLLPILGVIQLVAMGVMAIVAKTKGLPEDRKKTLWEQPLRPFEGRAFQVVYGIMVLSSIIINAGNWMFFASFLKLQGDLYCPSDIGEVTAIWYLVPIGIDLVFYGYSWLTRVVQG